MITFVPVGGLANRMRSIASAIALAQRCKTGRLHIIWFKDKGLNCAFEDIFHPLSLPDVDFREASIGDLILRDRPRKRNLYIPGAFQKILFKRCLYEKEVSAVHGTDFNFNTWVGKDNVYLASHDSFYPSGTLLPELFNPVAGIRKAIEEKAASFNGHTIGIHIRRTDHTISTSESPTGLFIEIMEREINDDPQTRFYLATDSEEEKALLKEKFGDKVITSDKKAARDTQAGIEEAVIEMFLLSRTKKIIGSAQSSFSEIAAQLTNIPYIALRKQ